MTDIPKLELPKPELPKPEIPVPDKQSQPAAAESLKKVAEKASKSARKLMSDRPPAPIELGGAAEKLPAKGGAVVVSPPPLPALPAGLEIPKIQ